MRERRTEYILLHKGGESGKIIHMWGIGSAGRALRSQCRGQRFNSAMLHHDKKSAVRWSLFVLTHYFINWVVSCSSKSGLLRNKGLTFHSRLMSPFY
jgi:hypothetical protein